MAQDGLPAVPVCDHLPAGREPDDLDLQIEALRHCTPLVLPIHIVGDGYTVDVTSAADIVEYGTFSAYYPLLCVRDVECGCYMGGGEDGSWLGKCCDMASAVGLCIECDDNKPYCEGHVAHWVHVQCAEEALVHLQRHRAEEALFSADPEEYRRTHSWLFTPEQQEEGDGCADDEM